MVNIALLLQVQKILLKVHSIQEDEWHQDNTSQPIVNIAYIYIYRT